jgi:hypothetical protein
VRNTPPSLRFLGRKVYVAAIVVLIAILRHGATGARMERLAQVAQVKSACFESLAESDKIDGRISGFE